eukprot:480333_1
MADNGPLIQNPPDNSQPLIILVGAIADRNDGDDPYIGNRVRRTIIISVLLVVFFALGLPLFGKQCKHLLDTPEADTVSSICIICASSTIIFCATLLVLFFIRPFGDRYAKWLSFGLMIGGVLYFIACIVLSITTTNNINSWGSESVIPSGLAVLLGFDVLWRSLNDEIKRVTIFFCFLALASGSLLVVYTFSPINNTFIYVGYLIIGGVTLVGAYITILCQDTTCCISYCVKDRKCKGLSTSYLRLLVTLILVGGSVSTVCGYYLHMDRFTNVGKEKFNKEYGTELTVYYIGYGILFWASCNICALDIAIDDING